MQGSWKRQSWPSNACGSDKYESKKCYCVNLLAVAFTLLSKNLLPRITCCIVCCTFCVIMICFRYHGDIPKPTSKASALLLLRSYPLADRFQITTKCIEKITEAASLMEKEVAEDLEFLSVFYSLPDTLRCRQGLSLFRERCQKGLLSRFGDVPDVIMSADEPEGLLDEFRSLPAAALLDWADMDTLKVHSENCVVLLMSAWVKANPSCGPEVHRQLASRVRVLHLTNNYLLTVLPNLAWFQACSNIKYLPIIQLAKSTGKSMSGLSSWNQLEQSWLRSPRTSNAYLGDSGGAVFEYCLSHDELAELYLGHSWVDPRPTYFSGFFYNVKISHTSQTLDHDMSFCVDWDALNSLWETQGGPISAALSSPAEVVILNANGEETEAAFKFNPHLLSFCSIKPKFVKARGFLPTDILLVGETFQDVVEQYTDEGLRCFKFTITLYAGGSLKNAIIA